MTSYVLSDDTLPVIFEAVPGKPYWRAGQVTGYRVFTGRPGRRDAIALFGDVIVRTGRYWDVIPAAEATP